MNDRIKNLTVNELQSLFTLMGQEDMQLILNALRALAGDTESMAKLQRLHVSIEQGLHRLLNIAEDLDLKSDDNDQGSRFFRPIGGFIGGDVKFVEVRLADGNLETLFHHYNGKVLPDTQDLYPFEFINARLQADQWEELHFSMINEPKFQVLP